MSKFADGVGTEPTKDGVDCMFHIQDLEKQNANLRTALVLAIIMLKDASRHSDGYDNVITELEGALDDR